MRHFTYWNPSSLQHLPSKTVSTPPPPWKDGLQSPHMSSLLPNSLNTLIFFLLEHNIQHLSQDIHNFTHGLNITYLFINHIKHPSYKATIQINHLWQPSSPTLKKTLMMVFVHIQIAYIMTLPTMMQ